MAHNKLYRNFIILQEDESNHSNSQEKSLSGYAKIEAKSEKCKISFYAQNLKKDEKYSIVLICYKKDIKQIVNLGLLQVNELGKGEAVKEYYINDIAGLDFSYEKISGAAICKHKQEELSFLMYGFMNNENIKDDWKKSKVVKCADKEMVIEKKEKSEKIKFDKCEKKEKEESKHKEDKECDHKKDKHDEEDKECDHKKDKHDEEDKECDHKKDKHDEEDKECDHKKDKHDEEDKECDHKKDKHDKEDDHEDCCKKEKHKDDEDKHEHHDDHDHDEDDDHHEKEHKEDKNHKHNVDYECIENCKRNESITQNNFEEYEETIKAKRDNDNVDPYDFNLRGAVGDFFNNIAKGFEEVKDKFKEIRYCKWYKVKITGIDDLCNTSDYNKYTVAYYPMLNYYPYIKKYGYFFIGYKCDSKGDLKYIVYGVPGKKDKDEQPYVGKTGFVTWMDSEDGKIGCWLMFYDYKNSTIVVPMK